MKVPMKWLKEYVDIKMSAQEYADRMVMSGTGVESVDEVGGDFDGVVAGKVLTCDAHPDSDHLHVCTVDVGGETPLTIVCGAPNVAAGQTVPVALVGATLPGGIKIKKGKLRGVESSGMICSGPELGLPQGLYPHVGEEGILVIAEDVAPGSDAKEIFGLDDVAVDFEILANRPDCLSIWGLARESSAVLDEHCLMPEIVVEENGTGTFLDYAHVEVRDKELCPRYCARVIEGVKIGPSPKWMRAYLHAAGVRPINNIVDITNYVMLETGHPMHAFDLDKVRDHTIVVRRAEQGETLKTLDGKEHLLTTDMLVIADSKSATGLAGIMGGEESEILEDTRAVLFECAVFDRTNNRLTSRALGVRTEASGRFERGVCVEDTMEALERACMLVNMLECGKVVPGIFDSCPEPKEREPILGSVERINRLISTNLSGEQMEDILCRLYIETTCCGDTLTALPPPWRGDIETEADLAEEVLRLNGYEHIPSTLMHGVTMAGFRGQRQVLSDRIKDCMVGMGWFEIMNFSFISPRWLEKLGLEAMDKRLCPVVVRNPLGEDTSVMRTSLVPSMLSSLSVNLNRGINDGKLFELAPVFFSEEDWELPEERQTLCLGLYGDDIDFYGLRDACACLLNPFGIEVDTVPGGDAYYHPGRKALLIAEGKRIGQLGEIHPDTAEEFDIEGKRVYVAELDIVEFGVLIKPIPQVKTLPKYPAVARDLALVMREETSVGPVIATIRKAAGKVLEDVGLFDIYRGAQVEANSKSVAFNLSFRAADRTLTEAEISRVMDKVLKAVESVHGARIRS